MFFSAWAGSNFRSKTGGRMGVTRESPIMGGRLQKLRKTYLVSDIFQFTTLQLAQTLSHEFVNRLRVVVAVFIKPRVRYRLWLRSWVWIVSSVQVVTYLAWDPPTHVRHFGVGDDVGLIFVYLGCRFWAGSGIVCRKTRDRFLICTTYRISLHKPKFPKTITSKKSQF